MSTATTSTKVKSKSWSSYRIRACFEGMCISCLPDDVDSARNEPTVENRNVFRISV